MDHAHYWGHIQNDTIINAVQFLNPMFNCPTLDLVGKFGLTDVELGPKVIRFGGQYETLYLTSNDTRGFCKTGLKEYDPIVVFVLIACKNYQPDLALSSDASIDEMVECFNLITHLVEYNYLTKPLAEKLIQLMVEMCFNYDGENPYSLTDF